MKEYFRQQWFGCLSGTALLVIVWRHAHWSVALCLTFLLAANECSGMVINNLIRAVRMIADECSKGRR